MFIFYLNFQYVSVKESSSFSVPSKVVHGLLDSKVLWHGMAYGMLQCVLNCFELYSSVCLVNGQLILLQYWGKMGVHFGARWGHLHRTPWRLVSTMSKYSLTGGCGIVMEQRALCSPIPPLLNTSPLDQWSPYWKHAHIDITKYLVDR